MPGCLLKVSYHEKYTKQDGTGIGYKWMQACREHRTSSKDQYDAYKMSKGCENKDGRYGFACTATIEDSCQIDVHHKDGNKRNNEESNKECLCRNCHGYVTKKNQDHQNRYDNRVQLNPALWDDID